MIEDPEYKGPQRHLESHDLESHSDSLDMCCIGFGVASVGMVLLICAYLVQIWYFLRQDGDSWNGQPAKAIACCILAFGAVLFGPIAWLLKKP